MRTSVALILLTGPPLWQFARFLHEYGLTFRKEDGWGLLPLLAVILLLVHVAMTLSAEAGQILNAEFFPFRGFLIFLVSGVAFAVAIFPQLSAESLDSFPKAAGVNLERLIAFPAWIWILIVVALAVFRFAS